MSTTPPVDKSGSEEDDENYSWASRSAGSINACACPFVDCDKFFSRPSRLQTHLLSHTGEKPFVCEVDGCDKSYARKAHLTRHMANAHSTKVDKGQAERLKCDECPLTFANRDSLKKHVKVDHTGSIAKHKCLECDATFTKHKLLKMHRDEVHKEITKIHKCPKCDKRFPYPRNLRVHLRTHESVRCEFEGCEEEFKSRKLRNTHMIEVHRNGCKYACQFCEEKFMKRSKYQLHMLTHSSTRRIFKCQEANCKRFYYHERNLRDHVRSYHEDKRFPCPYEGCEIRLASRLSRKRHMQLIHSGQEKPKKAPKKPRAVRKDKGIPRKPAFNELVGKTFEPVDAQETVVVELSPDDIMEEISSQPQLANLIAKDTESDSDDYDCDYDYDDTTVADTTLDSEIVEADPPETKKFNFAQFVDVNVDVDEQPSFCQGMDFEK